MIPRMTRRHAQKLLLAAAALVCVFAAGDQAAAETAAPRRVVSFNICADQLVVALADPAQIAGLSPTRPIRPCRRWPTRRGRFAASSGTPRSTIPLEPDLVLVGPRDRSVTQRLLTALGFRVVEVDSSATIAAARAQIRRWRRCSAIRSAARR